LSGPTLLAFAGSTRADSLNGRLLRLAAQACEAAGGTVTLLPGSALAIPLYDGDSERDHGLPEAAKALKRQIAAHDGLLIASPEYNGSLTPALKNALDWASRREGDEPGLAAYRAKTAAIIAASHGRLGGARSLMALRQVLAALGVHVIPQQLALAQAGKAFDQDGALTDTAQAAALADVARALVETTRKLRSRS
jgi:chromate reductase, NAD(P)H dehydrogenase (quinone)